MSDRPLPLRLRLEDQLGAWARFVARFRWPIAIVMLALTGLFSTFIPDVEVKMATEDFLFENDPIRATYDRFKIEFGQDQITMLAIEPPEIFDLTFLDKLQAFHRDLEDEVPYLEDITSLVNVRSVYGQGDELIVDDLLDSMPTNQADLDALRERVLATPFYRSSGILSGDGKATTVQVEVAVYSSTSSTPDVEDELDVLDSEFDEFSADSETGGAEVDQKRPFLTGEENTKLIKSITEIVERHQAPDFPILMAGGTMLTYQLTTQLSKDVPRFFGGGLLVIGLFLLLLFRRTSPVFLCILVVVPGVLSTFGLAGLIGIPFSAPAQLVPSFLLAVGVGYAVHLITIFLRELAAGNDRIEAIELAMRHSGLPIIMTALTTTTGVLSFLVAEMKPIVEMGLLSALGVAVALVYSMVFLPALLAILPLRAKKVQETPRLDAFLGSLAAVSARRPWTMIVVTACLALGALASMTLLRTSSNPTSWFPEDHSYRRASDYITDHLGGTYSLEILVDGGRENALHDPEVMNAIASLQDVVDDLRRNGAQLTHTMSVVDIAKETHQALNANDPAFYVLPQQRQLLAQELLLFENGGSDDLEKVVDSSFSKARFTIRSTWRDGVYLEGLIRDAEPDFRAAVESFGDVEITGMSAVIARTVGATTQSMLRSYALALTLITPLMIVLIGSLRAGLVSMVPNLVPIMLTLGMMGLTDIPIDMFTLLAGCIAIGLAVDDSIHFIASFRRYLALGHDPIAAVEMTMQSTGRALLFTSVVLTSGFMVLMLSEMLNLRQVGALTSFAISSAFLLDVTVTPALLVLTHRKQIVPATPSPDASAS